MLNGIAYKLMPDGTAMTAETSRMIASSLSQNRHDVFAHSLPPSVVTLKNERTMQESL